VNLSGWPDLGVSLFIESQLDAQIGQSTEIAKTSRFELVLPIGRSGLLNVQLSGFSAEHCKIASVNFQIDVAGGQNVSEVNAAFVALPTPICWTPANSNVTSASTLNGVWASDPTHVWAVGDSGTILTLNGSNWVTQTSGTISNLYGIWGVDAQNIWAVGAGGIILYWNGRNWTRQVNNDTTDDLYGIWGLDSSHIWALGGVAAPGSGSGALLFWDGSLWNPPTTLPANTPLLYAIWGSSANNIWAVGNAGAVLRSTGGAAWLRATTAFGHNLHGVWGADSNNVWTVGTAAFIGKWNGTIFTQQNVIDYANFHGMWGIDTSHIWAVGGALTGNTGRITKWNGTTWDSVFTNNMGNINAVWGSDNQHIWAVQTGGFIESTVFH
jgi:hypothetical protein